MVPFSDTLSVPRTWDVANELGAKWLSEGDAKNRRVLKTSLTARTVSRVGEVFSRGTLIVTPGDRDDLILATALAAMNGIPMAGIILTGGITPNDTVIELCQPALKTGMPVMSVKTNSFATVQDLSNLSHEIPEDDADRASQVTRFVAAHLDLDWLKDYFQRDHTPRLSPSAFRHQVVKKPKKIRCELCCLKGQSLAPLRQQAFAKVEASPNVSYLLTRWKWQAWQKIGVWSYPMTSKSSTLKPLIRVIHCCHG